MAEFEGELVEEALLGNEGSVYDLLCECDNQELIDISDAVRLIEEKIGELLFNRGKEIRAD